MQNSNYSPKTIIITASDSKYFELVRSAILSVRKKKQGKNICIAFFDLGCTSEEIQYLETIVNTIEIPKSHFNFPEENTIPSYLNGLLARPFLRQYFPDFEVYIWLDSDAWVQDWQAIDLLTQGALRKKGLAIVPEIDRNYCLSYGKLPWYFPFVYQDYEKVFSKETADQLYSYTVLNAGIFALHHEAPHWQAWEEKLREGLQNHAGLMTDQVALNYIVYSGDLFDRTEMLPAWCNWSCNFGLPAWDEAQSILVEPYLPHHPVGILHLTGKKHDRVLLKTIQGNLKEVSLRYHLRDEQVPDNTGNVTMLSTENQPQGSWDYISPEFQVTRPDRAFPNMMLGNPSVHSWPYLRREIPHKWYVDKRYPHIGFLSRDEAHILYNNALQFRGKKALEIGCWMGWSACHLMLAGIDLDIIDPILANPEVRTSVVSSLQTACQAAGIAGQFVLVPGYSPQKVEELALQHGRKWSLIFIDGEHGAPGPLNDAIACEKYAEADAMVLFHDLAAPDVAQGLDYFRDRGWHTMIYQTMQIMGVAWRGNIQPIQHQPDPKVTWTLPDFLKGYQISDLSAPERPSNNNYTLDSALDSQQEFHEIVEKVRPFSLLSEARLHNLYTKAKEICINDLPGHFVECGTYRGGAAAMLGTVIQRYSSQPRKVYAFDTFEGMPEPAEIDKHQNIPANQTGFGVGTLKAPIAENIGKICQLLNVQGIVIPVQGLFAQTLPIYKAMIGNIALLHADGDWYESTMDIFNHLYASVVANGIIQVDDYGHWEGCRQAVHDFEAAQGVTFNLNPIDYTGVWFTKT